MDPRKIIDDCIVCRCSFDKCLRHRFVTMVKGDIIIDDDICHLCFEKNRGKFCRGSRCNKDKYHYIGSVWINLKTMEKKKSNIYGKKSSRTNSIRSRWGCNGSVVDENYMDDLLEDHDRRCILYTPPHRQNDTRTNSGRGGIELFRSLRDKQLKDLERIRGHIA